MHCFQSIPSELFEINPFEKIGTDWMLITAEKKGKPNTMTASWGGFGVLWGKNVAYIVVRESRYTKEMIDGSDTFSLSFLNHKDYKSTLKYLGVVSGRDEDKINNARLHIDYVHKTPFINESSTVIICKKMCAQPMTPEYFTDKSIDDTWYKDKNYHTLYVGEVLEILAR